MAKTPRGKEKNAAKALAEAAAEQAKKVADQVLVLTPKKVLNDLLDEDNGYKSQIEGLTGELRAAIKNVADKKHLHKKAYADVKRFDRIRSNEELARHWNTLLAYMDMRGLFKRIESVKELPLDGTRDDDADAVGAGHDAKSVEAPEEAETGQVVTPRLGGRGRRVEPTAH